MQRLGAKFRAAARLARAFRRSRRGAAAPLVALAIIPMVGAIGLSVDAMRGYTLKSQLVHALDAAALAGGKDLDPATVEDTVAAFFAANLPPGFMASTITGPTIQIDSAQETIRVSASAEIPTTFLQVLGQDVLQVSAETLVQRSVRGLELALVMDNTGSMRSGGKITAMKDAAMELVAILYGDRQTVDNLWISVVPYAVAVNVGAGRSGWLTGYDPADYAGTSWKGCVEARAAPGDETDDAPVDGLWPPYFYPTDVDNIWPPIDESNAAQNDGTGPNLGCASPITGLTDWRPTIETAIGAMQPWHRGGTMGNLGLVWGWRTLSPKWRGLWGGDTPADMPFDYDKPLMDKAVVMLTDGVNQFYDHNGGGPDGSDYGGYGRVGWGRLGTTNKGAAEDEVDARLAAACAAMKAEGVIVFTITFQLSHGPTRDLYRTCASSDDHYYDSPSNAELSNVFQQIGAELSNLRIAQ
ncbi:MAG: VWA domain-containing protein [Alphaproteobacteria bacterium]|nr:VWA domain-containing protein [Alphaproteobacteria bacterium]